jgi:AcrR family transcriptional regulator
MARPLHVHETGGSNSVMSKRDRPSGRNLKLPDVSAHTGPGGVACTPTMWGAQVGQASMSANADHACRAGTGTSNDLSTRIADTNQQCNRSITKHKRSCTFVGVGPGTRDRILEAAMRLFADQGFRATTVGDIEAEAGLVPRRGALYRHFASKEAVFEACLERWIADVTNFPSTVEALLPLDDLRSELAVIARGSLQILARQRDLFRFLARDAIDFPQLVARVHDDLVAIGYRQLSAWFRSRLKASEVSTREATALAAVALASLAHYRQDEAVYGVPPGDVSEAQFVNAWVETWHAAIAARTGA